MRVDSDVNAPHYVASLTAVAPEDSGPSSFPGVTMARDQGHAQSPEPPPLEVVEEAIVPIERTRGWLF